MKMEGRKGSVALVIILIILIIAIIFAASWVYFHRTKLSSAPSEVVSGTVFPSWETFIPLNKDFSIKVPSAPQERTYSSTSTQNLKLFTSGDASGTTYAIGEAVYLPSLSTATIQSIFNNSINTLIAERRGNTLVSFSTSTFDGHPAIDYLIENNQYLPGDIVYSRGRNILVGDKAFEIQMIYKAENQNDGTYNAFVSSFTLPPNF